MYFFTVTLAKEYIITVVIFRTTHLYFEDVIKDVIEDRIPDIFLISLQK